MYPLLSAATGATAVIVDSLPVLRKAQAPRAQASAFEQRLCLSASRRIVLSSRLWRQKVADAHLF